MRAPSRGHLLALGLHLMLLDAMATSSALARTRNQGRSGNVVPVQPVRIIPNNQADECGRAPLSSRRRGSRVSGGEDVKYGEFPSFVRLRIRDRYTCGATLISDRHLITGAYCVNRGDGVVAPGQVRAYLGDHSAAKKDEHQYEASVASVCVAKRYDVSGQTAVNDWAVLELSAPANLSDYVQPACLPKELPVTTGSAATCYLVGFGYVGYEPGKRRRQNSTNFGPDATRGGELRRRDPIFPTYLQKMRAEQTGCGRFRIDPEEEGESRVCYHKYRGRGDACEGDGGAPILCLDKNKRWTVVAMVSYGERYCDGGVSNTWQGVYANVHKVLADVQSECLGKKSNKDYKGDEGDYPWDGEYEGEEAGEGEGDW